MKRPRSTHLLGTLAGLMLTLGTAAAQSERPAVKDRPKPAAERPAPAPQDPARPVPKPAAERPAGERPAVERPAAERPAGERPAGELTEAEQAEAKRAEAQRTAAEEAEAKRLEAERKAAEGQDPARPAGERGAPDKPANEGPGTRRAAAAPPVLVPGMPPGRARKLIAQGMSREEMLEISLREEGIHRDRIARFARLREVAAEKGLPAARLAELDRLEQRENERYAALVEAAGKQMDAATSDAVMQRIRQGRSAPGAARTKDAGRREGGE